MVFCDISKAFDRVWHRGLLHKIRQYGISGNLASWLSNYLANRSQKVFVGTSYSETKQVKAGVPQGSVLGPLLFLIYVNDIADTLISTTRLFADDSSLAVSSSDTHIMETTINSDLNLMSAWAKQWLVTFNPLKTEVMYFSLSNAIPPDLFFENTRLNYVENHKHLGVTLGQDGSWHKHISNTLTSASKVLGSMKMLKFKVTRKTLNTIYISYLRPILEYSAILWDNCTLYERDTLERIQYEAARIVTGLTRSVSIDSLLTEIGWVSLSDRRIIQKLTLVYKNKEGLLPTYLSELFPLTVNEATPYNLRNNRDFVTLPRRLEIYSKSVIPSSLRLWNDLDQSIRDSPSLSCFKSSIKELFKPPLVPTFFPIWRTPTSNTPCAHEKQMQ